MARRARETGRTVDAYNVTLTYPRQPALQRTWDVSLLPVPADGDVDGYVIYLMDVSCRKQAELLSTSESRLRGFFAAAADAIFVANDQGVILQANPAASRIFGYPSEELLGQPLTKIMPPSFAEEHQRFLDRYVETAIPHIIGTIREVQGRRKDGTLFPCELSVAESHGEEMRHRIFIGIIRDITERKRLEAELVDAHARLEAILDTVPLPLLVITPDTTVVVTNDAARKFYGEELANGTLQQMTRLNPATRQAMPVEEWSLFRALREGKPIGDIEQIIVFNDGREVPVLIHAAPVIVAGKTIGAVGVLQDLTQLKAADRAEERLPGAGHA